MKRLIKLLAIAAAVMLLCSFMPSFEEAQIYDKVLRLHVIASSDLQEDQALKLKVRDAILEYTKDVPNITGIENAREYYAQRLDEIKGVAQETVDKEGKGQDVQVSLGYEYYPTRTYADVSLPAGEYLSLRVMIGGGAGQNWWCVLYPPICLSAASAEEELVSAGFTPEQMQIITEGESTRYKIKFKILEEASRIWHKLFP
jgi:stage II sporulation protein R